MIALLCFFLTLFSSRSALTRFLLVILMIVKEASYPSLERRCLLQITDGAGAVEELDQAIAGAATDLRVRAGSALLVAQDPLTLGGKDRLARCMASENSWKPAACCPMPPT